jgi:antitoxin component of MazEF toxin-antitoxin module
MEEIMSRISVKLGDLEIEYEGEQKFITDGLLKFAKDFVATTGGTSTDFFAPGTKPNVNRKSAVAMSTSSIAQKLGAKTGTDLAVAAAAHLILVKKMEKFSHTELLAEMREAKTFYKKSYHNNLGNTLKTLVNAGRFNHLGGNDYSLSESEISNLQAKLA